MTKTIEKKGVVSIILPIFNQEAYLDISIPSVQNQTYKNLEIICVNDGSTDSSVEILKKYEEQDNRIIIISKKNGGLVDATIAGIKRATGEYIVFLDPDDYIGNDFVENFLMEIGDNDFIAMGYYRRCQGVITPQYLFQDHEYTVDEVSVYRDKYLYDPTISGLSNRFFISRWNKMYRTECVKKIAHEFVKFTHISLGEDSIFTFLLLKYCHSGKCICRPNSYFYNIGSQTSMMSNGSIELHCLRSEAARDALAFLLRQNNLSENQADILYYFLMESLMDRLKDSSHSDYINVLKIVTKKEYYINAIRVFSKYGVRNRILFDVKQNWRLICVFNEVQKVYRKLKKGYSETKWWYAFCKSFIENSVNKGFTNAYQSGKFCIKRKNAFRDMNRQIGKLESEITPIIKPFTNCVTDLNRCNIERNVFVFWWDGFDGAPIIVKKCLDTVKKFYSDCNIVGISKHNYGEFTDIHPELLKGFESGKISIQTFSDILRFNLLKKNGGVWIDATIYFFSKYDIFSQLENQSIASICFSTSNNFLQYKGEVCNWSGYFFAARKNAVFTNVMNEIFEKYYLKNGSYPIYFFIDVALMICKINKIDGGVLDNIATSLGDMFFLYRMLDQPYYKGSETVLEIIPQKLAWQFEPQNNNNNTFYKYIFKKQ